MPTTITLERHILSAQRDHPEASGTLTSLLYDIALAGKVVAREATRTNILEMAEEKADRIPRAKKLAEFAEVAMVEIIRRAGRVAVIASEHHQDIIPVSGAPDGRYVLLLDPLDGVSPTDYTVSVGAIFSIYRRPDTSATVTEQDCLQKGRNLVAAGYVLFGSSTVMVYSIGQGVHGFALDPGLGEFLLSHDQIRIPSPPRYYSVNHAHDDFWSPGIRRFVRYLQGKDSAFRGGLSLRYTGSLVADFHRNLLAGGIFCYPADTIYPDGKMRLNFEANPLAFIAEQAGGAASSGSGPILDIEPTTLHQRTPFYIGNHELVNMSVRFITLHDSPPNNG